MFERVQFIWKVLIIESHLLFGSGCKVAKDTIHIEQLSSAQHPLDCKNLSINTSKWGCWREIVINIFDNKLYQL